MKEIIYEKVGQRLKLARELKQITLEEAGNAVNVHKSTILRWENGETEKFKIPMLESLSKLYNVNPAWLMGYEVPMREFKTDELGNPVAEIPLLGTVKAGYDYMAQENWEDMIEVDKNIIKDVSDYFALKIKGDSMSPVLIEDDIVIIKKQEDFENGDLVVAIINGDEATIKKGKKNDTSIVLQPFNTVDYEPLIFTYDEMKNIPVTIVGIVKQLKREF